MNEDVNLTAAPQGGSPALRAQGDEDLLTLIELETRDLYKTTGERAAYRAGMSTAAAICDAVARAAVSSKRPVKRETMCRDVAKICGDEIMRIRERVEVPRYEPRGLSAVEGSTKPE